MPTEYFYQNVSRVSYWEEYTGRKLTNIEKFTLQDTKYEKKHNKRVEAIYKKARENGLYINKLTNMNGNCLFECFKYLGLCEDHNEFRKAIALLMVIMEHVDLEDEYMASHLEYKTPGTMFLIINDIPYVYCRKKKRLYEYTYQTMCRDIYGEFSWERINTKIILMVMSAVFQIKFRIFHNTGYISEIHTSPSMPVLKTINLGLMNEFHYIPLAPIPEGATDNEIKCKKYHDSARRFHRWAKQMALEKGMYCDDGPSKDISESKVTHEFDGVKIDDMSRDISESFISSKRDKGNGSPSKIPKMDTENIMNVELNGIDLLTFD